MHDHYDVERDRRWACAAADCLLPDVAPTPALPPLPPTRDEAADALADAVSRFLSRRAVSIELATDLLEPPLAIYRAACGR